ncbi:DUF4402 domain-containing protein [Sphingomonas sabuli]|uniref:DUF4402 domain-containing protein n=1 Tax=Sphingomonas sabuli TaxID=2764186 RepID=A0A7G9L0B3_9SPHN|nr:DUF4402 domain-containing protein [Sphingomonas sabuli]QNM82062.1 DUF4402 domain-containing protein [Sphingomonas sabuli]
MSILKLLPAAAIAASALAAAPAAAQPVPAATDAVGEALVLIPLKLTKIDDLDFGAFVSSPTGGTATINPVTGARTTTGGLIAVPADDGFRAYFGGAGSPNQQVIIAVSPPVALTSSTGDTIPVLGITIDGSPFRTIDPVSRTFFVGVGGSLSIAANQPEGEYSAQFWMTALYQ